MLWHEESAEYRKMLKLNVKMKEKHHGAGH